MHRHSVGGGGAKRGNGMPTDKRNANKAAAAAVMALALALAESSGRRVAASEALN